MALKQQIYVFFLHVVLQTTPTFEITNQMTCGVERTMLTLFTAASVTVASSPVTPVFCLAFWVKQSFIAEQIHANYATKTHFLVDTQQLLISATQHPWHV